MTREALPARRVFSIRALLLSVLTGCAAHVAASYTPSPPRSVQGVNIQVWHTVDLDNDGHACEPYFLRPALLCLNGPAPEYDGCEWTCSRWSELQQ